MEHLSTGGLKNNVPRSDLLAVLLASEANGLLELRPRSATHSDIIIQIVWWHYFCFHAI